MLERCPECKLFDRDQHIPTFREPQTATGQDNTKLAKSTNGGVTQWEARLFLFGQEHNSQ